MADFAGALRMNSIFPSAGFNPFSPPDMTGGQINTDVIKSGLKAVAPYIDSSKIDERAFQEHMFDKQRQAHLNDIAMQMQQPQQQPQQQPMNQVIARDPNAMTDYQKAQVDIEKQKNAQTGDIAQKKVNISQQDSATRQDRANVYAFKATHPEMKIVISKGGNFHAVDPITGKEMDLGIDSGTLSDEDKQNLIGEQRIEQIDKQGQTQKDVQGMRNEGNLADIAARTSGQKEINAAKPSNVKPLLPGQTRVDQNNKARELLNTRPDLAQFITIDPTTGSPTVTASPGTPEFDMINKAIFGAPAKDINLPAEKKTTPVKSKDNDPLGIR